MGSHLRHPTTSGTGRYPRYVALLLPILRPALRRFGKASPTTLQLLSGNARIFPGGVDLTGAFVSLTAAAGGDRRTSYSLSILSSLRLPAYQTVSSRFFNGSFNNSSLSDTCGAL